MPPPAVAAAAALLARRRARDDGVPSKNLVSHSRPGAHLFPPSLFNTTSIPQHPAPPKNKQNKRKNRSTVADGTCQFPSNFFGCESAAGGLTKGVKFIAEDRALECEGKEAGKCASRPTFSK